MEEIRPNADFTDAWTSLLPRLKAVPGDIAEFGVYNGGSTRILAKLFPERNVWAFDTYLGMPKDDYIATLDQDGPGGFRPQYTVEQMFGDFPNVIPVKGRFADSLPRLPLRPKIAFAYLDADLYNSTKDALWWLENHLSPGGIVFLDDYATHKGVQMAVDAFVRDHGLEFDGKHVIEWRK